MRVVMSYSHKDYNLAFSAAALLLEKTEIPEGKLYLYGSKYAPPAPDELLKRATYIGSPVDSLEYPLGPNMMFAGLMRFADKNGWTEPVFMCEPDGFPTCAGWYQRVYDAHKATGAYVSGSLVGWVDPKHYNGNMVIDPALIKIEPRLARVCYDPWDCFHAEFFAKVGAPNKEILNPRRKLSIYPTKWWWNQRQADGYRPAWVHGCQTFQMWENIDRDGFGNS